LDVEIVAQDLLLLSLNGSMESAALVPEPWRRTSSK